MAKRPKPIRVVRGPDGKPRVIRRGAAAMAALQANVPKVLRIGVIQGARIIEERIIRLRETVTVGQSEKNHFVTPHASVPGRFPLFELRPGGPKGDQYFLTIAPEMSGRVAFPAADGGVMDLAAIRASKKALPGSRGTQVALTEDCKGKVVIGDTTMLFQFVVPPPIQPRPQLPASVRGGWIARLDGGFMYSLGAAFAIHVGLFCGVMIPEWPKPTLDEILAGDFSPVNIQVVTASEVEPEDDESDEGETKPGEGEQTGEETPTTGDTGEVAPEAAVTEVKPETGPTRRGPDPNRVSIGGESLTQGQIASIGAKVENSLNLENLLGGGDGTGPVMGIGTEFGGVGGAVTDLMGAMEGAAGTTEGGGAGGYSTTPGNFIASGPAVGEIGGTGTEGAAGTGPAVVPVHTEVAKVETKEIKKGKVRTSGGSPAGGSGRMSGSVFQQKLQQKRGAIEACYNNALSRDPTLSGDLTFIIVINQQGSVSVEVASDDSALNAAGVTSCISGRLRSLNFTASPPEGGDFRVRLPISFIAP
ncbi:MAG: AgmX/PglI C-terminal domain-containing protein [Deltaproteobacteria bacterium]|nr:AgmX/PglI C-terminal domain-containing protein [Deltaproteobacteria bacterium]